ncbi:MAG: hypothetical protein JWO58_432 [Chitinophagaceae bacterium]|nr:hypothetical protein [Chitinophagaceae bacterium]
MDLVNLSGYSCCIYVMNDNSDQIEDKGVPCGPGFRHSLLGKASNGFK